MTGWRYFNAASAFFATAARHSSSSHGCETAFVKILVCGICMLQNPHKASQKRLTEPSGSISSNKSFQVCIEISRRKLSQFACFISQTVRGIGSPYETVTSISKQTIRWSEISGRTSTLQRLAASVKIKSRRYSPRVGFATICFKPRSLQISYNL